MSLSNARNPSTRFSDSWASVHFDLLRGLAAFFVLIGHWRNIFFVDFNQLTAHQGLLFVPYILTGAGHQSVVFFFVLSGYFIGGTIFRAMERNQWQWPGYLLRRLVRLWAVLVPALLLCLVWDRLGIYLGHAPALYGGRVPNHVIPDVVSLLTPHIFFSNLFFLQGILTPTFGSDGPLWSLAFEFWYYILFPLGLIAIWSRARVAHRLLCAILFLAVAWFVRGGILASFPIWLLGVVLFKLKPPSFAPRTAVYLRIGALLIYALSFFALSRIHQLPSLVSDYLLAGLTFGLLWILLSDRGGFPPKALSVLGSRELARFSYTLYAAHVPFLLFLVSFVAGDSRWYPTPRNIMVAVGVLFVVLLYTYVLAFFTEFRTDALRSRLERLLRMTPSRPALPSNPLSDIAIGHRRN